MAHKHSHWIIGVIGTGVKGLVGALLSRGHDSCGFLSIISPIENLLLRQVIALVSRHRIGSGSRRATCCADSRVWSDECTSSVRLGWLDWLQGGLLVLMVLPVVAQDCESVGYAVAWVLHLKLDRVLAVVHLLVVLGLLDCEDALLGIWLLWVDGEDHVVGDQSLFRLLACLVQDA